MPEPVQTLYPFAEKFQASTSGTTSVTVWTIPAKTIVTLVLMEVVTAATGDANNINCGDADTAAGFLSAQSICGATVGTIWGDSAKERGSFLTLDTTTGIHAGHWKVYTSAGSLRIAASAAAATEATVYVYVFGYRY